MLKLMKWLGLVAALLLALPAQAQDSFACPRPGGTQLVGGPGWLCTGVVSSGSGPYTANATDFDGTNDYMARGAALTGAVDGPLGIFNVWFRMDAASVGAPRILFQGENGTVAFNLNAVDGFSFSLFNSASTRSLTYVSTTTFTTGGWHQLLVSWDTNAGAGSKLIKVMIDGVQDTGVVTDASLAFSSYYQDTNWGIGASEIGSSKFNGCLSELYFNIVAYLDVTTAPNLALFRTALGKPANLGATGATPTGSQPTIYLPSAAGSFETNAGSGGNFAVTGALDVCSTGPSSFLWNRLPQYANDNWVPMRRTG